MNPDVPTYTPRELADHLRGAIDLERSRYDQRLASLEHAHNARAEEMRDSLQAVKLASFGLGVVTAVGLTLLALVLLNLAGL